MPYPTIIKSFDEFLELRARNELDRLLFQGIPPSTFRHQVINCFHNDDMLFESDSFLGQGNLRVNDGPEKDKVLASIDRAGARVPYRCEFYPSAASQQSDKYHRLGVKYENIVREFPDNPTFHTFEDWFLGWIEDSIIVPDSCIIIDHYLSKVILPRIRRRLRIRIPRFVLLELEKKGNRNDENKRLVFSAFNEIRKLRLDFDASPFPNPIRTDLQASFSQISGDKNIDSFIRTEIWDYRNIFGHMVLLTRDLIMACVASAEDIDAFYLCPAQPEQNEFSINNFSSIITEIAVTFNEIKLEGMWDDHSLIIEGMWSGKDIMDWGKNRLKMHLEPH